MGRFTAAWAVLAQRFAGNPLVIGYDLHNEPRPAVIAGTAYTPTWGDDNAQTDYRRCFTRLAGNLRAYGPGKLYFCEGLNYASDLTAAGSHPVTGGDVVYSMHDYSWYHPAGQSYADYQASMDARGGYLVTQGTAPLWIGEFGIDTGTRAAMTTGWMANFLAWARERDVHWCWWDLSAQTVKGTWPGTGQPAEADGSRGTFGLMAGQDWAGSESEMITILQGLT